MGQDIIRKNQNEYLLSSNLKKSFAGSELAAYEGRSRPTYENEWNRYIRSQ